jgi:ankyrin repeat protein
LLIKYGLEITDVHEDGYIPMHRACWGKEKRHTHTVKVFLDAGVPPKFKATNGKTCYQMTQNEDTKKLLKSYTSKKATTTATKTATATATDDSADL